MDQAAVRGATLAYREHGDGEPVLLLHPGFIADGMLPLLAEPALHDHRLLAYHRRGYGDSNRRAGAMSVADQAADALGLLDALGVGRAHLVGSSVGAVVALQVALTAPARVGSLVLMEPLLAFALDPAAAAFVAAAAQAAMPRFFAGDRAGALDAWLTPAFGPGFRAVLDRSLPGAWQRAIEDADTAFGVEVPALQSWPVDGADLARLRPPTLSVVHTGDRWRGFDQIHSYLLAHVPGCEGTAVDVSSHLLQIQDAGAVAAPVADFLARHPLSSPQDKEGVSG
jgi:pimeloyl-ACP methyl ester carboxylesterase